MPRRKPAKTRRTRDRMANPHDYDLVDVLEGQTPGTIDDTGVPDTERCPLHVCLLSLEPLVFTWKKAPTPKRRRYCFKCHVTQRHLCCENCSGYLCMPHSSVDIDYPCSHSAT